MTYEDAIAWLKENADDALAEQAKALHEVERPYMGIRPAAITEAVRQWRESLDLEAAGLEGRMALASQLWQSNIFEARIAATKLLIQARIRPDDSAVWELITTWLSEVDCQALADYLAEAGSRRVAASPARLDEIEAWLKSPHLWTRRAALTFTQHYARMNNLKPAEKEARARILAWAGLLVADREHNMQKAIGLWLKDLSKHDPLAVQDYLTGSGITLKSFARKIARTHLE